MCGFFFHHSRNIPKRSKSELLGLKLDLQKRGPDNFKCIDKKNFALINKIKIIKKKLDNYLPTIPTTIKDELECNIFLRSKDVESFSKLRDLKDKF